MKFTCEICEKKYDSPEEATICEKSHQIDDARSVDSKAISDAVNAFYAKYAALPSIELNNEALVGLKGELIGGIVAMFDAFIGAIDDNNSFENDNG